MHFRGITGRAFASTLMLGTALATTGAVLSVGVRQAAAQTAPSSRIFDIKPQSLQNALTLFGMQADVQVSVDAGLLRGLYSQGVSGPLLPQAAIGQLLAGTGLDYRFTSSKTVLIGKPDAQAGDAADGATLLRTIEVSGDADARLGPVVGYIAENSGTGTKSSTPLITTPQSISVVTKEQAEAQGAQSLVQALRYSAGVAAEVRGSATRYDLPYIRGFGSPTDSNQYLDGLRLLRGGGYAITQVETYGLERIEFLKGPSSTLYGGAPAGGMINTVSKTPTATPQHEVELLYGSHDRMQMGLDFSGPIDEDGTLLYRFVGLGRKSDTQVVNTKEERIYLAPSLSWVPDADTTLTVSANYQHDPEGGYYGTLPTLGSLWYDPVGQIPRSFNDGDPAYDKFDREQWMIGYQFEHRFNDVWTVKHNLRYLDNSTETESVGTASLAADGHTINRYALGTDETLRGITSDLQLQAEFDTGRFAHTTLFGFDYQYSDWRQIRDYGAAPSIDFLNPVYGVATNLTLARITDQKQETSQSGFYAQDQIELDNWTLVAGMRYDLVSIATDNYLTSVNTTDDSHALSGKVGLSYKFDSGIAPYVSYSTSFLPLSGTDANGDAFKPTTAEQYEVGIKYKPVGLDALFTLAYFDITQHDVVTYQSPVVSYQTGEQRSRGLEFEAKAALSDALNLTGAFTYTRAEVVKGLGADVGDYPIGVPDYTASLWADYTFQDGALEGLTLGGGLRYVGKTVGGYDPNVYSASADRIDVPGYTLVDASISYDFGKKNPDLEGLTANLAVNNLFDKTYVTCLANNFCNYGTGRTIYGSLKFRW